MVKTSRNDPCPCGSGKKYKQCCMKKDDPKFIEMENNNKMYTFKVTLVKGPAREKFVQKNPEVSRTITIMGGYSLEDLHDIIFKAFDRCDDHMYEFQFGEYFNSPRNKLYVLPQVLSNIMSNKKGIAGTVSKTLIGALNLAIGQSFYYWFDFGDDWIHKINVISINDEVFQDTYPKIVACIGDSPPQYVDWNEEALLDDE